MESFSPIMRCTLRASPCLSAWKRCRSRGCTMRSPCSICEIKRCTSGIKSSWTFPACAATIAPSRMPPSPGVGSIGKFSAPSDNRRVGVIGLEWKNSTSARTSDGPEVSVVVIYKSYATTVNGVQARVNNCFNSDGNQQHGAIPAVTDVQIVQHVAQLFALAF